MAAIVATRVTGRPAAWARDMALVGGLTSAILPTMLSGVSPSMFGLYAGIAGAITGALLGAAMPAVLDRARRHVPLWALLMAGPLVGCAWGALAGGLGSLPFSGDTLALALISGGIAGALQFGWWWFPYTFQTVRGGRTWPVMLASFLALPVLAAAVFFGTLAFVM
jgi:hypothetical protein